MTLACTAFADQHHRFAPLDITALGQIPNLRGRNLRCLSKVELLQGLHAGHTCVSRPITDGVAVSLFTLHLQQGFQISDVSLMLFHRLFRQRNEVGTNGRYAHQLAVLPDAGVLQVFRVRLH